MKRIAIVGGGIAGVAAAYFLAQAANAGAEFEVVLFESGRRLGGIVETVREGGFVVECGPDGWVGRDECDAPSVGGIQSSAYDEIGHGQRRVAVDLKDALRH